MAIVAESIHKSMGFLKQLQLCMFIQHDSILNSSKTTISEEPVSRLPLFLLVTASLPSSDSGSPETE